MCACTALHRQKMISRANKISKITSAFLKDRRKKKYSNPTTKKTRFTAKIKDDTLMKSAGLYPVLSRNIIL
jgi:hypothetical protein